ncbi:MAG: BON domain-containing protein [Nitrospinota bacterium]|nr:MAG: BON domain-containing protein [Nitrospinota bacterium]
MGIITISRGSMSGGKALAERVAEKLGYRCVSSEVIVEAAQKYGISEPELSRIFDRSPTFWEMLTERKRIYLTFIQAAIFEQALQGDMVYHGNAGQELLREVPHVLKVRLVAPLELRVQYAQERHPGMDRKTAIKRIQEVDEERTRRMSYFYNVDWRDPLRYDLVIDLGKLSIESAADIVVEAAQRPEFRPTEASQQILQDLALRYQILGVLASHPQTKHLRFDVTVERGRVQLRGAVPAAVRAEARALVQSVSGVKEVVDE